MDEFELCYMLEETRWIKHLDGYEEKQFTLITHLDAEEALEELDYWFEIARVHHALDDDITFYELPPYSKGWYKKDGEQESGARVRIKLMD